MPIVPPPPDGRPDTEAEVPTRFEDIAQDGRYQVTALMPSLGATAWRSLLTEPFARRLLRTGVVPILSRLVLEAGEESFAVASPVRARGRYELAHVLAASGEIERLLLCMWAEATAPIGRTYGTRPDRAGEIAVAGKIFAEHTLTRPFADPSERKVKSLDVEGTDPIPPRRLELVAREALTSLPAGARWIEEQARDPAGSGTAIPVVFGLLHTDSNQHVNSLVYVRMFEEAVVRCAARAGRRQPWLVRHAHVVFRKPCFAGDELEIALRLYERDGRLGAVGSFAPPRADPAGPPSRPHVELIVEG